MKGWKTWVGTIGYVMCEGARQVFPEYAPAIIAAQNMVFLPLGVVGIGHKLDKLGGVK